MRSRMPRGLFTVAHFVKQAPPRPTVAVYRTWHTATLARALKRASKIRLAGYPVWIEQTGSLATQ